MSRTFIERESVRAYVERNPGCTSSQVSSAVGKTIGATRNHLSRLLESGHLVRQEDLSYVATGLPLMQVTARPVTFANVSSIFGVAA